MMNEDQASERTDEFLKVMQHSAGESDRGIVLIVASYIDICLQRILESVLVETKETEDLFDGPYAPFASLSGKTQAAFVMGLITKSERERIDAVRRVRNVFAHQAHASFEHPDITKICRKPVVNGGRMTCRDEFLHMAINIVPPLLNRDVQVASWRRAELTEDVIRGWHEAKADAP